MLYERIEHRGERSPEEARQLLWEVVKLLAESSSMFVYAADRHGFITFAQGYDLPFGVEPAHLVGHTIAEVDPAVAALLSSHHQRALLGETFSARQEINGRTWDLRYAPLPTPDGIVGLVGVGQDVTDRVPIERSLAAMRRRDAGVADLTRAALLGASKTDLARAAASLVGREVDGLDYVCVCETAEERAKRVAVWMSEEIAAQKEPSVGSTFPLIARADGHVWGYLGLHARSQRAFGEDEVAFLHTVANVLAEAVARHKAEQRAQRRAASFRNLAENLPDLILRVDRDLHVVYVNSVVERLTGRSERELLNQPLSAVSLQDASRVGVFELALRGVLKSGQPRAFSVDATTIFGPRAFDARIVPEYAQDGSISSVVVAARDVTEYRRASAERSMLYDELLRRLEQLQQQLTNLGHNHVDDVQQATLRARLNQREQRVLSLIATGWSNREIAAELGVSHGTVKNDVTRILQKLDVSDRAQAAATAVRIGLVGPT